MWRKHGWLRDLCLGSFQFATFIMLFGGPVASAADADGRELFTREWVPGDERSHGGDGLGPLFNESSCVACHNQGGVGGGGPAGKNAQILTAFLNNITPESESESEPDSLPEELFLAIIGDLDRPTKPFPVPLREPPAQSLKAAAEQRAEVRRQLTAIHPSLATSLNVVLHRNGTYAGYASWRQRAQRGQFDSFDSFDSLIEQIASVSKNNSGETKPSQETITFFAARTDTATPHPVDLDQASDELNQNTSRHRRRFSRSLFENDLFIVHQSERNTTALFGNGLIDAVPDAVLEEMERQQKKAGIVSGRVARLKDGKAGRFGWKAQTASLEDFVLTACAVELGLNVTDHAQSIVPHLRDYRPAGLDLNAEECQALVSFVRHLPAPRQRPLADSTDTSFVETGRKQFEAVGCANCHVPDVGDAVGIYSDLLLHDMGPSLGDAGIGYGNFLPDSTPEGTPDPLPSLTGVIEGAGKVPQKIVGATRQEWRTPPLWGVRDSSPYLHDGRAESLELAIALHGGEAEASMQMYQDLSPREKFELLTFLKSLVAPETSGGTAAK